MRKINSFQDTATTGRVVLGLGDGTTLDTFRLGAHIDARAHGATGNGATDDTAALQAALNAAAGRTLFIPPGTYKITGELTIPTGVTIEAAGVTIDATGLPTGTAFAERVAFRATGAEGTSVAVANAIATQSYTVTGITSTTGFAPGDLVLVYNEEQPVPGMTRTDRDKGELRVVKTVDSATQLTFTTGSLFAYGTNGLAVRRIDAVKDITIRGLKIVMGGVTSGHNAIRIVRGRNINIHNLTVDGAEESAINLSTVYRGRVTNCDLRNATSPSYATVGYGVSANDGARDIRIEGNTFHNCRHFVAGGGRWPTVYTDVVGNHGEVSSGAAYDCHESTFWWKFVGNTAISVQGGVLVRGQYVLTEGNIVVNCETHAYKGDVWDGVTEQRGIRFINNYARNSGFNGVAVDGAPRADTRCVKIDCEVRGNTVEGSGYDGILIRHFDGMTAVDNMVVGASSNGMIFLGLSETRSKNLTWGGNVVRAAGQAGVKAQYVDDLTGSGGRIESATLTGLHIQSCTRSQTTGLVVRAPGWSGVWFDTGSNHTLTGCHVSGGTNTSYDAVRVSGAATVSINGGYVQAARRGVYSTTTDNVIVTGVIAKDTTSADKINVDATNKVVANNLV